MAISGYSLNAATEYFQNKTDLFVQHIHPNTLLMKKFTFKSIAPTIIFTAGIIATIFGILNPDDNFTDGFLLAISIGYLLGGWYYFKGYYPEGHPLLLFFIGYLYASIFMSFTFFIAQWPLAKLMISIVPVWVALLVLIIIAVRKKLPKEGLIQLLIEGGILLSICVFVLLKG
jgi:hypothetical protein